MKEIECCVCEEAITIEDDDESAICGNCKTLLWVDDDGQTSEMD